jgi:hypothetical protein
MKLKMKAEISPVSHFSENLGAARRSHRRTLLIRGRAMSASAAAFPTSNQVRSGYQKKYRVLCIPACNELEAKINLFLTNGCNQ